MSEKRKLTFKPKKCLECGKEFIPRSGTQRYCDGPHITYCKICGKEIQYTCSPNVKPNYCSQECINKGHEQTVMERYGVKNVSELQSIRNKISTKNKSDEVVKKREQTCLQRYGATNPSKSDTIKKKLSSIMKSEEFLKKREQTCIQRYGTSSPMQNDTIKARRRNTNIARYGIDGHFNLRSYYEKRLVDGTKVDNYLEFKQDPKSYILSHYNEIPTLRQLQIDLGTTDYPIYKLAIQHNCKDLIKHSHSYIENEIFDFLSQIVNSNEIVRNDRICIKPLELDFYLPKYKFAIECNPSTTYNSSIPMFNESKPLYYKYHQNKSIQCQKKGIFLFHIFGYEWNTKRNIIQSMIKNSLCCNKYKLGARQTYVSSISYLECMKFLNENHLQGHANSKIRLCLKLKSTDEIVAVMTFGKLRNTMGKSKDTKDSTWELSRFCTKLNCNVIGGASKLFEYFLNNYHPSMIVSFSDVAHTKGKLYEKLGFQYQYMTSPNYVWADLYDRFYYNRVSCQKQYLKKLLDDDSIDLNQTEKQIMESHRFVRVYDSGVVKWIYNNS